MHFHAVFLNGQHCFEKWTFVKNAKMLTSQFSGGLSKIFLPQIDPGQYLGKVRKIQHKQTRRFRDK